MLQMALVFVSDNSTFFTFNFLFFKDDNSYNLTVHFLGKSVGKISEGVNLTQKIHPVEAIEPGAEHIVRLLTKNWVDNNSIFEDVIETRGRGEK